jgi:hypothetical protein
MERCGGIIFFSLEKPEGHNNQGVSAEYDKSKVNSQWNGVAELLFFFSRQT